MIRIIVALDKKRGIARNGQQPWSIPADEQYFKQQTMLFGANVLMGKKTLEVIGHPLPGRRNYIVSHQHSGMAGVEYVNDLSKLLEQYKGEQDLWVIGGASIYEQALPQAAELYITKIAADLECDQFFPAYEGAFQLVERSDLQTENGFNFIFTRYTRRVAT